MKPETLHQGEWLGAILDAAEQAGINYGTAQIRGAALQAFEEQDGRAVPVEGAIAHAHEGGMFPWLHIAVYGDSDGRAVFRLVQTADEMRPHPPKFAGLTFVRWMNGRDMGPMNEPFQEF